MKHRTIIFAGPSLAGSKHPVLSKVDVRPPCRQGDIYLAACDEPEVIGIIDGFFEGQPSVWHKEILWGLNCGIHVFGAASMGALRAAELDAFGMRGIGRIYEWYRDGTVIDDEEVALVHAPREMGYATLSLATVNVRATLDAGQDGGEFGASIASQALSCALGVHYKQRSWKSVLTAASDASQDVQKALQWASQNEIDQKAKDADALLSHFKCADFSKPFVADFEFEQTEFWHRNTRLWERLRDADQGQVSDDRDEEEGYRLFD
ncbi:MAG: TfuA-like protein [Ahrensia sp.]|nr:TfuA-like protein [Ahrensia sp.]